MSEVKVNKISPRTNCGTVTLGDSGDTITIPAGATITNNGTAAGFGATGAASWDTTVKTTGFTAVSGVGYFVNTTSGAITVTLPASPNAGDVVAVSDYAGTADTNTITIGRNGSNINGAAADLDIQQENSALTLVYVDSTQGWKATDTASLTDIELQPAYVTATGGTITCCGDYKIHTFTGPGTFCVSAVGNPVGSNTVDYLVVAGGAGGGGEEGGGGGAGGYRESSGTASGSYTVSPLGACVSALPVTIQGYSIEVGGGGPGQTSGPTPAASGSNSSFSSITSAGGGRGGGQQSCFQTGASGGSGGGGHGDGGGSPRAGGTGNAPPVSPPQGQDGGNGAGRNGTNNEGGGGGGGATVAGTAGSTSPNPGGTGGNGGTGATSSINGTPTARAGGGGGGANNSSGVIGSGGAGGGGDGTKDNTTAQAGSTNTGGGGGGGGGNAGACGGARGGAGGSGIVIIRYKFQN